MKKNNYPGKFIVVEGLDGSGQSTQVSFLRDFFIGKGKQVVLTKEPTLDSQAGKRIREILDEKNKIDSSQLQELFARDRKEHLDNIIIPALKQGKIVISDRYFFSSFAFGASDGLDLEWLIKLNNDFLLPDSTIILKVRPEVCIARIENRGEPKTLFEKQEKLAKVWETYAILPERFDNVKMIDGEKTINEVFEQIKTVVLLQKESKVMDKDFAPNFKEPSITEQDEYLLKPFFTNLDQSVFGVTFLPPEVIGALCSRASRAKEDLRVIFLNEFLKPFIGEEGKYSKSLKALVKFLHKYPIEVIFSNPKGREFYIKWLAQFGDDSIAQMGATHLIYTGISQLAIKQIEDMRIGIAPIEKSTRYVDYSSKVGNQYRYYTDPTLEDMRLLEEYTVAMDALFRTYTSLLTQYMEHLKRCYSNEEEKLLKAKAFDTVRPILPVATLSQLSLFGNGQAFEYMVSRALNHELGEVRWGAQRAFDELSKVIPAFLRRIRTEESQQYRVYLSEREKRIQEALREINWQKEKTLSESSVRLLEYDPDGENKVIVGLIYPGLHEPFDNLLQKVRRLSDEDKEKMLKKALEGRYFRFYKIPRAFENTYLKFEVVMNIGAWRDLHRHRMHTQYRERFDIYNGFDLPEGLKEAGLDKEFTEAVLRAEDIFRKVERLNPEVAQYCCTLAHRVRFIQYQNLRSFFWESELRTIPQGHPDYRKIEHEKIKLIKKIYPLLGKYLLVDMKDYDFARRGTSDEIKRKEEELRQYFQK